MFRKITLLGVLLAFVTIIPDTILRLSYEILVHDNEGMFLFKTSLLTKLSIVFVILILFVLAFWQKQCRLVAVLSTLSLFVLANLQSCIIVLTGINGYLSAIANASPVTVTIQLWLGLLILWGLFWLYLRTHPLLIKQNIGSTGFARFTMSLLFIQIILGVWLSANYIALGCTHSVLCSDTLSPPNDYLHAFDINKLSLTDLTAIAWIHGIVALLCFVTLSVVIFKAISISKSKRVRNSALLLGCLLVIQILPSSMGFYLNMPLWFAIAHNVVAMLMMMSLISIVFYNRYTFLESETKLKHHK